MLSTTDKMRIRNIANTKFNTLKINTKKIQNDCDEKIKIKTKNYYNNYSKLDNNFENKNKYFKSLKPTKKGGGRIIQPGGGFRGN
tara:strand:- start:1725 stop:1979 length:255 start_codon:yes stop_codon:yes gene_type:complete